MSHRLDPATQFCVACGAEARQIENDGAYGECPGFSRSIGPGVTVIITTHEEMLILKGDTLGTFTQRTMFELRDAIDDGVRLLRDGGRSKVAPQ